MELWTANIVPLDCDSCTYLCHLRASPMLNLQLDFFSFWLKSVYDVPLLQ